MKAKAILFISLAFIVLGLIGSFGILMFLDMQTSSKDTLTGTEYCNKYVEAICRSKGGCSTEEYREFLKLNEENESCDADKEYAAERLAACLYVSREPGIFADDEQLARIGEVCWSSNYKLPPAMK